jgi:hypothetical protein
MRSSRPLIALSSRGGTSFGSSQRVMSRTRGNPRTMITSPGTTHSKTVCTIRLGSGGILDLCVSVRVILSLRRAMSKVSRCDRRQTNCTVAA